MCRFARSCRRRTQSRTPSSTPELKLNTGARAQHHQDAFIKVVGSKFVQRYLGEGPRMVRQLSEWMVDDRYTGSQASSGWTIF
ncbi:hypothetical protein ACFX2C_012096 [Malus domestica]